MAAPVTSIMTLAQFDQWAKRIPAAASVIDWTPALKRVKVMLVSETKQNFVRATTPAGKPWKPFKRPPSKKRGGKKAKLLRDTGRLMASVTSTGADGHVETLTKVRLVWGTNLKYAAAHNFGIHMIPAREYIGVNSKIMTRTEQILAEFAEEQIAKV